MAYWYYATGADERGPIDEAGLQQLFAAGKLPPETAVWQSGMVDWSPASQVLNFFEPVSPAGTPPPIPPPSPVSPSRPVSTPPPLPRVYVITPVVPKPKPGKTAPPPPPPTEPVRKAGFVRQLLDRFTARNDRGKNATQTARAKAPGLFPPLHSRAKPSAIAPPPTLRSTNVIFKAHYGMGLRMILALILCGIVSMGLAALAGANKRGLIIDYVIHLTPAQASTLYGLGAALCGLICVMIVVGLFRSLMPPWNLIITDTHLILPRTYLPGASKIPLSSIQRIQEWTYRGRAHQMKISTTQGRYKIAAALLTRRSDYDFVKQTLTRRAGAGANLPPWKRPVSASAVSTSPQRTRVPAPYIGWTFGLTALAFGGYYTWIGLQSGNVPTTVPIGQFETNPPDNRNVVITGGHFDFHHSVKFILYHSSGDTNPEVTYYVPLLDAPATDSLVVPKVVVKMSEATLNANEKKITSGHLHVTRLTQWDFQAEVKDKMKQSFGANVDNMIVVEYGGVPGFYFGLTIMGIGLLFILFRNVFTRFSWRSR